MNIPCVLVAAAGFTPLPTILTLNHRDTGGLLRAHPLLALFHAWRVSLYKILLLPILYSV